MKPLDHFQKSLADRTTERPEDIMKPLTNIPCVETDQIIDTAGGYHQRFRLTSGYKTATAVAWATWIEQNATFLGLFCGVDPD